MSPEPARSPEESSGPDRPSVFLPRIASLYQSIQRDRVGLERSLATKPDVHDAEALQVYAELQAIEKRVVIYLNREIAKTSIWTWLQNVKGIGPRLGGMLVGMIDIYRAPTVSSLWRYAGMAVVEAIVLPCPAVSSKTKKACAYSPDSGTLAETQTKLAEHLQKRHKMPYNDALQAAAAVAQSAPVGTHVAEKRRPGEKLPYNNLLKKTVFLCVRSFVMGSTQPYEGVYREAKDYYQRNRPTWPPLRVDLAARRKAGKLFLSHLWQEWRKREGLPVGEPFIFGMGEKTRLPDGSEGRVKHDPAHKIEPQA